MTYTSDTLDIPALVQGSITRIKAEQETKRKQETEANARRDAEKSRLAGVIRRQLGHISSPPNSIMSSRNPLT